MPAPAIGTVIDGYRFMGGNPNDQKAWKRVDMAKAQPPAPGQRPQIDPDRFRREQDSLRSIEDAKGRTNWLRTGLIGGWTREIPGSPAYNLDKDLEPLRSRTVLGEMAQMRQGSAVGATGLGAMDRGEREMLAAAEGSLDIGQSEGQIDKNLDRLGSAIRARSPGVSRDNPIPIRGPEDMVGLPEGAWLRTPQGQIIQRRRNAQPQAGKTQGQGWKILGVE